MDPNRKLRRKPLKATAQFNSLNTSILDEIECPVCNEYMSSPIFQCPSGHTICRTCKLRLANCPTCRIPFTDIRNRALERLTENILYPCTYEGCYCSYTYQNKEEHESECLFAHYFYPLDCLYKGPFDEILSHVRETHSKNLIQYRSPISVYIQNFETPVYVIEKGGCLFVVRQELNRGNFGIKVTQYGPKDIPNDYNFCFEVKNSKQNRRIAIEEKCSDQSSDTRYTWLPMTLLNYYMQSVEVFTYTIDIKKCQAAAGK